MRNPARRRKLLKIPWHVGPLWRSIHNSRYDSCHESSPPSIWLGLGIVSLFGVYFSGFHQRMKHHVNKLPAMDIQDGGPWQIIYNVYEIKHRCHGHVSWPGKLKKNHRKRMNPYPMINPLIIPWWYKPYWIFTIAWNYIPWIDHEIQFFHQRLSINMTLPTCFRESPRVTQEASGRGAQSNTRMGVCLPGPADGWCGTGAVGIFFLWSWMGLSIVIGP